MHCTVYVTGNQRLETFSIRTPASGGIRASPEGSIALRPSLGIILTKPNLRVETLLKVLYLLR